MMLFTLAFFAVLLPYGKSTDTSYRKTRESNASACHVDDIPVVVFQCPVLDSGHVLHGEHCQVTDVTGQRQSYIVKCVHGSWINDQAGIAPKRSKRQWTAVGGSTGAVIGTVAVGPIGAAVGLIIGGVAGIFCDLFCPKLFSPPPNTPSPNTPPTIQWDKPTTSEYYANPGNTFAVVKWYSPTASDKQDGNISPKQTSGLSSNSEFPRGKHTIIYKAEDSSGMKAFSQYTFRVIVRVCKSVLPNPANGHISCEHPERIAGTVCNYNCVDGYRLSGYSSRICQTDGTFSGQAPTCQIKTCPNSTHIYPRHGQPICSTSGFVYKTVCKTKCENGYKVPSSDVFFATCQSTGQWSNTLSACKDSEPPSILDCPGTQYVYADRGLETAVISWNVPTVTDNSGELITAIQTKGQSLGNKFTIGFMEIRYTATDSSGNKSPDCIFSVRVDQQICDPPKIIDSYMNIDCANGFSYGSNCSLTCRGSYPLIGNDRISCERNTTYPKVVYWDMGTDEQPYCKQNKCPELQPPIHGALICDKWMFGVQCMMHCNEDYDLPAGTGGGRIARFTGQFTCSISSGKWSPVETVPGCTVLSNPLKSYLPGELYYFTGVCTNISSQKKIKENFMSEMQNLQQDPGWKGICPNDCNVDNVELKCGTVRRRRDVYKKRLTRQTNTASVLVTFNIVVKWKKYGNSTMDTFNHLQTKAKSLGLLIEEKVQSGSLDVEAAEVDKTSFQTGFAAIKCEPGRYPRYSTLTCASCSLGSIYDDEECTECPKGSYREDDNIVTCTTCPPGTSTVSSGTINYTDCVSTCKPGYYSLTGVIPCTPCSRFHYGADVMATQCEQCGPGLMTMSSASTDISECKVYDAVIGGGLLSDTIGKLQDGADSVTLALWIKIPVNHDVSLHVTINDGTDATQIDIGKGINITLYRTYQQTDAVLKAGSWQHVALVIDSKSNELEVFVQGSVQFTSPIVSVNGMWRVGDSEVLLSSSGTSDIHISGLLLTNTALEEADIQSLATTCYHTRNGAVTMEGFKYAESNYIELVSPSICDTDANCEPDPCNSHTCIGGLDGFTCRCDGGFTGDKCQISPDYCKNHQCENGATCHNLRYNYTCSCTTRFKGILCDYEIVDGGWASWSNWSDCSKSCDGGNRTRQRECNDPYPDPDGTPCTGEQIELEPCNEESCPVCPKPPRSYGTEMDCNVTSDLTTCHVRCRDGLWFAPGFPPLPEYKCGMETSYTWNGKPPSCSDIYYPENIKTVTKITYESANLCNKGEEMKAALLEKSLDNIDCAATKTCTVDISTEGCIVRSKSSLSAPTTVIVLQVPLEGQGDQISIKTSGTDVSPTMKVLLQAIGTLENSTRQFNTSTDILKIEVDGQEYDAFDVESYGKVDCRDGKIQLEALCTDCPHGTYNTDSSECIPCPYGTYQDTAGSTFCKKCPDGSSTPLLGSSDISDCSTTIPVKEEIPPEKHDVRVIIGGTLGALILCGVIVGIAVWLNLRRKGKYYFQNQRSYKDVRPRKRRETKLEEI
ncbi:uncharacterized protein LOC110451156 [Mizuhopecten yessoensis]|uniref:Sushi, von Willebrand factor type A, EGF and pentraxin domain-containing protein 1 n=1 Tax=Mizuhopecten yessoensis TaxID=6573 RepID=A0A210QM99_MIZYE|nr:uncharacterized protein LOC110451156 [Mizuhopecten yessoensis]XP_021354694.1 uncharacterized protein LOC110451156 [Mizuhopecten yessoensis]XP_021354695.1 uncharacterized protein LOC110451156 [Mizuhopecten yessoensis]OWF49853.1 Sushi, von Willebrand factor type A, EGF and pentraxin domain-containing protein 1 [Mizuhopecten yessoensis]